MILNWLKRQHNEVERAYYRAVARRDLYAMTVLSDKLISLTDEIQRLGSYKLVVVDDGV